MNRWVFILLLSLWSASQAAAQQFYTPRPQGVFYSPTQGDDPHLFNLNPAANATTWYKGGAIGLRQFRNTQLTFNDDSRTVTKAQSKEDVYGFAVMSDLGAGMAAGLSAERNFAESIVSRSTSTMEARDLMVQQAISGRVLIDLATGLRVGFIMRYVSVNADTAGTFMSPDRYRIRYHGNMIGNGAGAVFNYGAYTLGASYAPAMRGKSEILFEERIISDPGMAHFNVGYKFGAHAFGLGLQRWIHRRDERAVTVTSQDGQRTLLLNGMDPEKNIFPIVAYHIGAEFPIMSGYLLRASVVKKDSDYISDSVTAPTTISGYENMTERDYHLALRVIRGTHDVMAGAIRFSRSKTLTSLSGSAGSIYKSSGNALFVSWGGKL